MGTVNCDGRKSGKLYIVKNFAQTHNRLINSNEKIEKEVIVLCRQGRKWPMKRLQSARRLVRLDKICTVTAIKALQAPGSRGLDASSLKICGHVKDQIPLLQKTGGASVSSSCRTNHSPHAQENMRQWIGSQYPFTSVSLVHKIIPSIRQGCGNLSEQFVACSNMKQ